MRRLVVFVGMCGLVVAASAFTPRRSAPVPCVTPGPAGLIQAIKASLVASDSSSIHWRNGFGIAGVDSSSVRVISDSTVCTAITHVVDSVFKSVPATQAYLAVLRVGPRYIAFGPTSQSQSQYFLDTTYVFKAFAP